MGYQRDGVDLMSAVSHMALLAKSSVASITYVSDTGNASALTTYTFASQNFGTAFSGRYLVAYFAHRAASAGITGSSATIGGVGATKLSTVTNGNGCGELWGALVPTGTSGTTSITWSGGVARCVTGLWSLANLLSTTPTNTYTSTASPLSVSANISAGGVALAGAYSNSGTTATWAGLTENYDNITTASTMSSGASLAFASAQTGLTISCTGSSTLTPDPVMCVAAFR